MTDNVISLYIHADDYPAELSWRLVKWCQEQGADEWTVTRLSSRVEINPTDRFEAMMSFYQLSQASREHMSAFLGEELVRPADLWQLSSEALTALQEFLPEGLFTYAIGPEDWIEDPAFYRQGELMLGIVSHEYEGFLRVTEAERQELERLGFPFRPRGANVGY